MVRMLTQTNDRGGSDDLCQRRQNTRQLGIQNLQVNVQFRRLDTSIWGWLRIRQKFRRYVNQLSKKRAIEGTGLRKRQRISGMSADIDKHQREIWVCYLLLPHAIEAVLCHDKSQNKDFH